MTASLPLIAAAPWLLPLFGLAAGFALGLFHFHSLRWNCAFFARGQAGRALLLQLARLALVGLVLFGLARLGAGPLLGGALGLVIGRMLMMRRERDTG